MPVPAYTSLQLFFLKPSARIDSHMLSEKKSILDPYTGLNSYSSVGRDMSLGRRRSTPALVILIFIVLSAISFVLMPLSTYDGLLSHLTRSSVPDLPLSFTKSCEEILIPPPGTNSARIEALGDALPSRTVWISEPGPSSFYFIGAFSTEDWWLSERPFLIAISFSSGSPRVLLLTPAFEALRASLIKLPEEVKAVVQWVEWKEYESPYEALKEALKDEIDNFVLDGMVRDFVGQGLRKVLQEQKDGEGLEQVAQIRQRKSSREIDLLLCANQKTLHAIRKTRSRMYFGISESQTGDILKKEMASTGLVGGAGLVLFGEDAALPHGSGTDRKLGRNDLILIDAGGQWGHYYSDITRTFALKHSAIPSSHVSLWEAVRRAQSAPSELVRTINNISTTLTYAEMDQAARSVITSWSGSASDTSQPDFSIFTHRLGHGIGLEGHEFPYLVQGSIGNAPARSGHVFSLEPGIYLPASGGKVNGIRGVGVRLEDCFAIVENEDGQLDGIWLSGPVQKWGDI